jgi:hypothetical protein
LRLVQFLRFDNGAIDIHLQAGCGLQYNRHQLINQAARQHHAFVQVFHGNL